MFLLSSQNTTYFEPKTSLILDIEIKNKNSKNIENFD